MYSVPGFLRRNIQVFIITVNLPTCFASNVCCRTNRRFVQRETASRATAAVTDRIRIASIDAKQSCGLPDCVVQAGPLLHTAPPPQSHCHFVAFNNLSFAISSTTDNLYNLVILYRWNRTNTSLPLLSDRLRLRKVLFGTFSFKEKVQLCEYCFHYWIADLMIGRYSRTSQYCPDADPMAGRYNTGLSTSLSFLNNFLMPP